MLRKGLLGYLPVNIVQAIAGFGAVTVFTRLLSPADYGAYALGFSVMTLLHTCLLTWLEASVARFHASESDEEERRRLFATVRRAWLILIVAVPAVGLAVLFVIPTPPTLKAAIAAGVAAIVTRSALKMIQERRRAAGEVGGFARLDILQTGGGFLIGIALALAGLGAASPLLGTGIACGLGLALALPRELPLVSGGDYDPKRLRTYAAYGLPLSLSLVMGLALATTDRFVLAAFLNEASVGAYHAGYSLSSRTLDVLFIWLGMAGGPAAVAALERGGHTALRAVAKEQAALIVLMALPAATGLALVARPLVELMVGADLRAQSAQVTPWIAAGGLFSGLTTYYFHTAFTLGRKTRRLLVAMAIPAAANLVLALILIPRFGLMGAAWATTASYAIGLAASVALGRSAIMLPIPWLDVGKALAACALMAAVLLQLPPMGGVMELALKSVVGGLVYGAAALALNIAGSRGYLGKGFDLARTRLLPASPAKAGPQGSPTDV